MACCGMVHVTTSVPGERDGVFLVEWPNLGGRILKAGQMALQNGEQDRILPSFSFLDEMEAKSGQPVSSCFQCFKCSNGCPAKTTMDIYPGHIVRFIQLGLKEILLTSRSIWTCKGCKTCQVRCPNGIYVGSLNEILRQQAMQGGYAVWNMNVSAFLHSIKQLFSGQGRRGLRETGV